jgi:integrase
MPRPATGSIVEHRGKDGRIYRSLRFRAYGKRYTEPLGVVSLAKAEAALRHTLADVERGTWQPPVPVQPAGEPEHVPTFHEFAASWWAMTEQQWAPATRADYRWRLEVHLVPFFGKTRIDEITGTMVRRYVAHQQEEGRRIREAAAKGKPIMQDYVDKHGRELRRPLRPLSARSINMTVTLLGQVLEAAMDDDELGARIPRNAARNRRIKERAPARTYLDTGEQLLALLVAAGELDREAARDRRHVQRQAMVATLLFTGPRIGEALSLRWKHVDLASDWLTIAGTKTDQAARKVRIRKGLHASLASAISPASINPNALLFPTRSGAQLGADNFRNRTLAATVKRANENLAKVGQAPLPKLTPHSLRRTFCSILYALGESPATVMAEMGHRDPALSLAVYAQAMRRDEHQIAKIRAVVDGVDWANMGERDAEAATGPADAAPQSAYLQA